MTITIKGTDYECKEITIECVPYVFDPMKEKIRYLKSIDVNLNYGATSEFPASIDYPKKYNTDHFKMLGINFMDITRNDWFKQ